MHEIKQKNPVCYEKERRRKQAREQRETEETLSLHHPLPPRRPKKSTKICRKKLPARPERVFSSPHVPYEKQTERKKKHEHYPGKDTKQSNNIRGGKAHHTEENVKSVREEKGAPPHGRERRERRS
jgi:hypothetical protein